jgi:hypothetical protein
MREVVAPGAGVRVEVAIGLSLPAQRDQQPREQRVLENVGEVAGVEEVAIESICGMMSDE